MDTISPVYARLVLRELERRDIDPAPLFTGTAMDRQRLLHGGDISMRDFLHILTKGDQLLGDKQLGFMLGRDMHVFAMGPVGAGLALAPTLRDGLQLLESYTRLHATYIDISARSTMHGLTITILYAQETGYLERLHTETAVMLLQQYLETLVGEPIRDPAEGAIEVAVVAGSDLPVDWRAADGGAPTAAITGRYCRERRATPAWSGRRTAAGSPT